MERTAYKESDNDLEEMIVTLSQHSNSQEENKDHKHKKINKAR